MPRGRTRTPSDAPVRGRFCCPDPGHGRRRHAAGHLAHGPRDRRAQPRPRRRRARRPPDRRRRRSPGAWPRPSSEIEGVEVPVGCLDVAFYRDDIGLRPVLPEAVTDIPVDLDGHIVVLVDDVLFTGRTIRAALDALHRLRPAPGGAAGGAWSTAATASCRSGPTTWARTCPPGATRWST